MARPDDDELELLLDDELELLELDDELELLELDDELELDDDDGSPLLPPPQAAKLSSMGNIIIFFCIFKSHNFEFEVRSVGYPIQRSGC